MATTQIGWYNLKEDQDVIDNGYECAAWFEKIHVPAGRYPLYVHDLKWRDDGEMTSYINSAYYALTGDIICDDFGTRYFGMPIGNYDMYQNAGKPSTYHGHVYLYEIASQLLSNPDTRFELFPEYEPKQIDFIAYDGELHTTHGIFRKGG